MEDYLTIDKEFWYNSKMEFHPDAIVARYGKDGMTYWNGEFNEKGEGIFVEYQLNENPEVGGKKK